MSKGDEISAAAVAAVVVAALMPLPGFFPLAAGSSCDNLDLTDTIEAAWMDARSFGRPSFSDFCTGNLTAGSASCEGERAAAAWQL